MTRTPYALRKLAYKLLDTFSKPAPTTFHRYWPLSGSVESFSERAVGPLEEGLAQALREALEKALRTSAPYSSHDDAETAGEVLGSRPRQRFKRR